MQAQFPDSMDCHSCMGCRAKKERTLDVICNSPNEFELWFWGVQIVKHYPPQAWAAHVQQLQQQQLADALRNSTKHAPWESKVSVQG